MSGQFFTSVYVLNERRQDGQVPVCPSLLHRATISPSNRRILEHFDLRQKTLLVLKQHRARAKPECSDRLGVGVEPQLQGLVTDLPTTPPGALEHC